MQNIEKKDHKLKSRQYSGALVEMLKSHNKKIFNVVTGLVELRPWPKTAAQHPRVIGSVRIYNMSSVLRNIYIMPNKNEDYYLNNYNN